MRTFYDNKLQCSTLGRSNNDRDGVQRSNGDKEEGRTPPTNLLMPPQRRSPPTPFGPEEVGASCEDVGVGDEPEGGAVVRKQRTRRRPSRS